MSAPSKDFLKDMHARQGVMVSVNLVTVIVLWYLYLVGVACLWFHSVPATLVMIVTVGGFLFTWLAYYRHELWHNYFPGINNPRFFDLVSFMMFSDPQVYRIAHPAHHKYVHTIRDIEFFCERHDQDPAKRKRQFLLELLFGNMAWELVTLHRLYAEGKADRWEARKALFKRLGLLALAAVAAAFVDPRGSLMILPTFLLTAFVAAHATRHNQWIEHLGLRDDGGTLHQRDMLTRNLPNRGILNRLWNFYNHNDPLDHVLHHTEPKYNTRGVAGVPMPVGSVYTSIPEHFGRVVAHYRSLCVPQVAVAKASPPVQVRESGETCDATTAP